MDKQDNLINIGRLIIIASIKNISHWGNFVSDNTSLLEKKVLKEIIKWADGFSKRLMKNNNPDVKNVYDVISRSVPFTTEILSVAITIEEENQKQFLVWAARYINYLNKRSKGELSIHPEWFIYGEDDYDYSIEEQGIRVSDQSIPKQDEVCLIKTHDRGDCILTVYDHTLKAFIDYLPSSPVQYDADKIWRWRSVDI